MVRGTAKDGQVRQYWIFSKKNIRFGATRQVLTRTWDGKQQSHSKDHQFHFAGRKNNTPRQLVTPHQLAKLSCSAIFRRPLTDWKGRILQFLSFCLSFCGICHRYYRSTPEWGVWWHNCIRSLFVTRPYLAHHVVRMCELSRIYSRRIYGRKR